MGPIAAILPALGTVVSIIGTVVSAVSSSRAAKEVKANAEYDTKLYEQTGERNEQVKMVEAQQLKAEGDRQLAISQRESEEERRQTRLRVSAVRAAEGTSGTVGPSAAKNIENFFQEGKHAAELKDYAGVLRQQDLYQQSDYLEYDARIDRYTGQMQGITARREAANRVTEYKRQRTGSILGGASSLAEGLGSFFSKSPAARKTIPRRTTGSYRT